MNNGTKAAMLKSIEAHQRCLIQDLEVIHESMNSPEDTAILLALWRKKRETWENTVRSLGEDCVPSMPTPEPCTNFEEVYEEHVELCEQHALPKRVGDSLKAELDDCLATSRSTLAELDKQIAQLRRILGSSGDAALTAELEKKQADRDKLQTELEEQQTRRDALPEECILEINTNVIFESKSNEITNTPDLSDEISNMLKYPDLNIVLTATTSAPSNYALSEGVGGDLIIHPKSGVNYTLSMSSDDNPVLGTTEDLMMIRALAVKQIFVDAGVAKNRIETVAGGNIGMPATNQKVTLKYK